MVHQVGFFVYSGHQLLDLAGAMSVFQMANEFASDQVYEQHVLSKDGGQVSNGAGLPIATERLGSRYVDTFVIVGGGDTEPVAAEARTTLLPTCHRASRVASVCTGTFILAATGLLDGCCATTHWRRVADLRTRFPSIRVEPDAIFVRAGRVWTSAGVTAGIDMALALVTEDHGAALAKEIARELVVYYKRPGGQSQFSGLLDLTPESERISRVIAHIRSHLDHALTIAELAKVAHLSPRQFSRVFQRETGETPAKAVKRLRVETAKERIDQHDRPIEHIAAALGFGDPERMRRAFIEFYGMSPQMLRRTARAGNHRHLGN